MIQRVAAVIGRTFPAKGVFRRVQRRAQGAPGQQAARDADGAQRLEAVRVLHHAGLQRLRRDRRGETVGRDGMVDRLQPGVRIADARQERDGFVRGQPGGPAAVL